MLCKEINCWCCFLMLRLLFFFELAFFIICFPGLFERALSVLGILFGPLGHSWMAKFDPRIPVWIL